MSKRKQRELFNPVMGDLRIRVHREPQGPSQPEEERVEEEKTTDEARVFREAMAGVQPLDKARTRTPKAHGSRRPAHPAPDDLREGVEELKRLVRGSSEMEISFTDEYMEGVVRGVSRKIMRKLKRGQFPVQDYLDLHGLTRQEAQERVREFLVRSHRLGLRCVLIVHGRGLNSPSSFPVLKDSIPGWFTRGPGRKLVLAFATARPYDGGAGAVYVLLRRRGGGMNLNLQAKETSS
ncbi:MAG: Smr/MutS family protein [Desulfobacteraceae bacterium]